MNQERFRFRSEAALRQRKPEFLCIGQPHAGADLLQRTLAAHREVRLPKDAGNYFSYNYHRGERWYLERFVSDRECRVGEIGPMYLYGDLAPARIAAFRCIRKLIVMLRDPRSWLSARYLHLARGSRRARERAWFLEHHGHEFDRLCVHSFLALYLALFDREAFLFVTADELKAGENAVAARLAEFLEIDSGGFGLLKPADDLSRRKDLMRLLPRNGSPHWLFEELWSRRQLVNEQTERLGEAIGRDLSEWLVG